MRRNLRWGVIVSFMLLIWAGFAVAQDWELTLNIASSDRSDTVAVVMGVHSGGSDMFDTGLDVPQFPMPGGIYGYFPLDDPAHPEITMLSKDIRSNTDGDVLWQIGVGGDTGAEDRVIFWNADDLPFAPDSSKAYAGIMQIGAAYPGMDVTEWTDMTVADTFAFGAGKVVHIDVTMESFVDTDPPEVTEMYPPDGSEGLNLNQTIGFNIVDDVSGVDTSTVSISIIGSDVPLSDFEITPIPNGYSFLYYPPTDWSESTWVCTIIQASDLATPPHTMAPDTFCFLTIPSVPCAPPSFEDWSISDGDTGISIYQHISLKVRNYGRGIDSSTIVITANGVDITSSAMITRISGFTYDYKVDIMSPTGSWDPRQWYTLTVSACDRCEDPGPICAVDTMTFMTSLETLPTWAYQILVWSSDGTDTTYTTLHLGTDPAGSDGWDAGLDVPDFSPDFATFAYFPLNDIGHPEIPRLQQDIRGVGDATITWEIRMNNPYGYNGIKWDLATLPDSLGAFRIGIGPEGDISWDNMSEYTGKVFDASDKVYIMYRAATTDTTPPEVTYLYPACGATDIPVSTDIIAEIRDGGSGVDGGSIVLYVNDHIVPDSLITMELLSNGYRITYTPPTRFAYNANVSVRILADDLNAVPGPNHMDFSCSFRTASSCAPIFGPMTLGVMDISGSDTTTMSLGLGTATDASAGRDSYDVPTFAPPSGPYAYFPLTGDSIYTMLSTDFRNNCAGTQYWEILIGNASGSEGIFWTPGDIFLDPDWTLGISVTSISDDDPTDNTYDDMRTISSESYTGAQKVYIALIPSVTETYCINGTIVLFGHPDSLPVDATAELVETGASIPTESDGTFSFCSLADGVYTLILSSTGYGTDTVLVTVSGADEAVVDTLMPPCYVVNGTVTAEGSAAVGAIVTIGTWSTVTGLDGTYEFGCIPAGSYDITFQYTGYPDTTFNVMVSGVTVVNFNWTTPIFHLDGTVSLDGVPVEGAQLYWCGAPSTVIATTDTAGHYDITGVAYGIHCLEATFPGYESEDTTLMVDNNYTIDFDLSPATITISGIVTLDCDMDNSGVTVSIDAPPPAVYTGPDGAYEFAGLAWDTTSISYTITAEKDCYATVETTVTPSADMTVNLTLYCLAPVDSFTVTSDTITRPAPGEVLTAVLNWVAPSTTPLTIDHYQLYRGTTADFGTATALSSVDAALSTYTDSSVVEGTTYYYWLDVVYDATPSTCTPTGPIWITPTEEADPNDILIIDYDNAATPVGGVGAEAAMGTILDGISLTDAYTTTLQDPADFVGYDLGDYSFIIVELGINDVDNTLIPVPMQGALVNYVNDGGYIYVEGPDFGHDYNGTSFFNLFGISYIGDGYDETVGNVETAYINSAVFGGMSVSGDYAYMTLADRSVDEFGAVDAAIAYVDQDSTVRGTAYRSGVAGKRYASSIYLGALSATGYDIAGRIIGQYLEDAGIPNTAVTEMPVPKNFRLAQNTPNPFNAATVITVDVPKDCDAQLSIYNVMGKRIATIVNGNLRAGSYNLIWDASEQSSGIYFARFDAGEFSSTIQMILMK